MAINFLNAFLVTMNFQTFFEHFEHCQILDMYALKCQHCTHHIVSLSNCHHSIAALQCKEGMFYRSLTSPCRNTCENPNAENECNLPQTEGCVCPSRTILKGGKCIPYTDCGKNAIALLVQLFSHILLKISYTLLSPINYWLVTFPSVARISLYWN